jgi:MraZ protein
MLRGNYTARIDDKGRLKLPSHYRRYLAEKYGPELYVTSLNGESTRIYPLPEWVAIEQRLALLPSFDPVKRKVLDHANYYGKQVEFDNQGRVLLHPLVRKSSGIYGDVAVMGYLSYLEVWDLERFQARLAANPFTGEDEAKLTLLGI